MKYDFSYSTIADVYAIAEDEDGLERSRLITFAVDLEREGIAWYGDKKYVYRDSPYGMEIVSVEDFMSESEDEDE